jgi:hypothetical protein
MGFILPPDDPQNPLGQASAEKSNVTDGRQSFDITTGNVLVEFFNKNSTPYPVEVGGPSFDLIPIQKQKDIMVNVARMHAQQEYDRIMSLVTVLQQQAESIRRRLEITDWVHAAKYDFQIYHGQCYWLLRETDTNHTRLVQTGPNDWTTGVPPNWEYICQVKWLGDYTWIEVGAP